MKTLAIIDSLVFGLSTMSTIFFGANCCFLAAGISLLVMAASGYASRYIDIEEVDQ